MLTSLATVRSHSGRWSPRARRPSGRSSPRFIFIECALVVGMFLPGDTMLLGFFAAGPIQRSSRPEPMITTSVVVMFGVTVTVGIWRYRQDMRKPVETGSSLPDGERAAT